jgi:hypothetical protein
MALTAAQRAEIQYFRAKASLTSDEEARLRELESIEEGRGKSAEQRVADLEKSIELLNEEISLNESIKGLGETVVGLGEKKLKQEQALLDIAKEKIEIDRKAGILDEEAAVRQHAENARQQRSLEIRRQGLNEAENFAARWFGITRDPKHGFTKFLTDPSYLEGMTSGLSEIVDGTSIMTSTIDKAVEATVALAIAQDQAVVNFRKSTGASGEFDDNIRGLERGLFTAGVSAAEAGESIQTLFLNVTDFTEMSENQQKELAENVAVLNELGVSAQTSAKNIQFATKVLGMSTKQAAGLQRELFTFAQDLGVSVDQIASDFETMGPLIAALGDNGVDAFRKLEVQAKNTGLAMADLLALTKKFDTFDGAADSVGKLNALLGGPYLNTLELVAETDPSKRFEILKERVDMAGKSFDDMEYYERKALATAIGLNEQQLALMMRGDIDLIREPKKSQEDMAELAKQTAQFNTILEELGQVMRGLAVELGPLVSMFKSLLQVFSPIIKHLDLMIVGMVGYKVAAVASAIKTNILTISFSANLAAARSLVFTYGTLTAAMMLIAYVLFVKAASPGLITILGIATAAFWAFGGSVSAVGTGLTAAMPGLLAFAAAMLSIGISIGLAAAGISLMVNSLGEFGTGLAESMLVTAMAIHSIVEDINSLDTMKTVALGATMVATSLAAGPAAAVAAVGGGRASGGNLGPPPTINVNLSIDGKEFATVVNNVEVSKYGGPNTGPSTMYDSVIKMIEQGLIQDV